MYSRLRSRLPSPAAIREMANSATLGAAVLAMKLSTACAQASSSSSSTGTVQPSPAQDGTDYKGIALQVTLAAIAAFAACGCVLLVKKACCGNSSKKDDAPFTQMTDVSTEQPHHADGRALDRAVMPSR